jgi:hypothetical protein
VSYTLAGLRLLTRIVTSHDALIAQFPTRLSLLTLLVCRQFLHLLVAFMRLPFPPPLRSISQGLPSLRLSTLRQAQSPALRSGPAGDSPHPTYPSKKRCVFSKTHPCLIPEKLRVSAITIESPKAITRNSPP